jgi:hypothetical protein
MSALVCDLCGGKLVMQAGGVAQCDTCGMEYTKESILEKLGKDPGNTSSKPSVTIDKSNDVSKFFDLAQSAYKSGNNAEAETYCNKILEIDTENHLAWYLKGLAVGWQTTLGNNRIDETAGCFSNSIKFAGDDLEDIADTISDDLENLIIAIIKLAMGHFAKYPDGEEVARVKVFITDIFQAIIVIASASSKVRIVGLTAKVAEQVNIGVVSAYNNKIQDDYGTESGDDRPSTYDFTTLIERVGNCIELLELAIDLSDDDLESDIQLYENIIVMQEKLINSASWDWEYVEDLFGNYNKRWYRDRTLTDEAKKLRRAEITKIKSEIQNIKSELDKQKKERIKQFWDNNEEIKVKLEQAFNTLAEIKSSAKDYNYKKGIESLDNRISELESIRDRDRDIADEVTTEEIKKIEFQTYWEKQFNEEFSVHKQQFETALEDRKQLLVDLKEQQNIVDQNKKLFGEEAKKRKAAKDEIKKINIQLNNIKEFTGK